MDAETLTDSAPNEYPWNAMAPVTGFSRIRNRGNPVVKSVPVSYTDGRDAAWAMRDRIFTLS